jgi:uncharacterized protein
MFRPLALRTVRWRPLEGQGLEHLTLRPVADGIVADGVVIGERGGTPYGARYHVECDPGWRVRNFRVETTSGKRLSLRSDGEGRWQGEDGALLPDFDGCIDIDLAASPFTNTLPIRRLNLTPSAGTAELQMLYVPFDTLEPVRDGQHYTCLEEDRLYRYAAEDRSFAADLPVDEDGLVTDYPALFERLR